MLGNAEAISNPNNMDTVASQKQGLQVLTSHLDPVTWAIGCP